MESKKDIKNYLLIKTFLQLLAVSEEPSTRKLKDLKNMEIEKKIMEIAIHKIK